MSRSQGFPGSIDQSQMDDVSIHGLQLAGDGVRVAGETFLKPGKLRPVSIETDAE